MEALGLPMSGVSLFRKWRSQNFADLVGQEAVVRTLRNVLAGGSPARAYLFCGPRGTGKTSSARIFAKAINCPNRTEAGEPCNQCSLCREITQGSSLDVQEIDAASHTQVEKIRDFIVEKVHFAPVSADFKVYIIDEVHKLSTSSFNALLKTLEEPPPHVVFILCTTHPHELPPTILSRCQRYDFRPLTLPEMRDRLLHIAGEEQVDLAASAADQIARAADGSLRDALVLFEQAITFTGREIRSEDVIELLGLVDYQLTERLVLAVHQGKSAEALGILADLCRQGRDLRRLAGAFLEHLRQLMLLRAGAPDDNMAHLQPEEKESLSRQVSQVSLAALMRWIRAGMELSNSIREGREARLLWEMMLVELTHPEADSSLAALQARVDRLETRVAGLEPAGSLALGSSPVCGNVAAQAPEIPARRVADASKGPERTSPRSSQSPPRAPETTPPSRAERASEAAARAGAGSSQSPPRAPETTPSSPVERASKAAARPRVGSAQNLPRRVADASEAPGSPLPGTTVSEASPRAAADSSDTSQGSVSPDPSPGEQPGGADSASPGQEPEGQVSGRPGGGAGGLKELWRGLMDAVRQRDKRLYGVLADARPVELDQEALVVGVPEGYTWHRQTILGSRSVLEECVAGLTGRALKLECRFDAEKRVLSEGEEHRALVDRAAQLFAGEIVEP